MRSAAREALKVVGFEEDLRPAAGIKTAAAAGLHARDGTDGGFADSQL